MFSVLVEIARVFSTLLRMNGFLAKQETGSRRPHPEANMFGASKETVVDDRNPPMQMHRVRCGFPVAAMP
jgi:hypothetical protein